MVLINVQPESARIEVIISIKFKVCDGGGCGGTVSF